MHIIADEVAGYIADRSITRIINRPAGVRRRTGSIIADKITGNIADRTTRIRNCPASRSIIADEVTGNITDCTLILNRSATAGSIVIDKISGYTIDAGIFGVVNRPAFGRNIRRNKRIISCCRSRYRVSNKIGLDITDDTGIIDCTAIKVQVFVFTRLSLKSLFLISP